MEGSCPWDGGDPPMNPRAVTAYMAGLTKKLKITATFHSLRHFVATELVDAGVDLPTAAGHLGHDLAVVAAIYLHRTDERGAKAGAVPSSVVSKAPGPGSSQPAASQMGAQRPRGLEDRTLTRIFVERREVT